MRLMSMSCGSNPLLGSASPAGETRFASGCLKFIRTSFRTSTLILARRHLFGIYIIQQEDDRRPSRSSHSIKSPSNTSANISAVRCDILLSTTDQRATNTGNPRSLLATSMPLVSHHSRLHSDSDMKGLKEKTGVLGKVVMNEQTENERLLEGNHASKERLAVSNNVV